MLMVLIFSLDSSGNTLVIANKLTENTKCEEGDRMIVFVINSNRALNCAKKKNNE